MGRKNVFANCNSAEELAAALQYRMSTGNLTIAEQKAVKLLAQLKGWVIPEIPVSHEAAAVEIPLNVGEMRKQLAEGLRPNDSALDWILNSPDEIFLSRVERFAPWAVENSAMKIAEQALQFVVSLRDTVGGKPVTLDDCLAHANGTRAYKWNHAKYREGLRIILEQQTETGYYAASGIKAGRA